MSNASIVNFAAGETSPRSRGRFDAPWFLSSCRKLVNFICEVAGPARFRPGFRKLRETRGSGVALLVPFQLNDSVSYILEFTNLKLRAYKNEELLVQGGVTLTITGVTKANPGVVTAAALTSIANGDDVLIEGIVGMTELNGRVVRVAGLSGATFQLTDPTTGANINTTNFTTYSSGGTLKEIWEVATPYLAADLAGLQWAQNNTQMYLVHPDYAPRKVTVDSADVFALATYSRTADPFSGSAAVLTVNSIVLGAETVIQFVAGSIIYEDVIYTFASVVGTTEINTGTYYLEITIPNGANPRAYLRNTATRAAVDSSAWTAYTSGGTATPVAENPLSVTFYEGRLVFIGTNQRPNTIFASRSPIPTTGVARYDDFTGGTDPSNACFFTLAPANGQVDYAAWARGSASHLLVGTFGGPHRVSGGGLDEPMTPNAVNARQFDSSGCEAVMPAGGPRLFYVQRGGRALRTVRFSNESSDLESYDMTLNAEHIGAQSRMTRAILQTGRPDIIWVLREDGILAGMTVQGSENVAGWHRQKIGGTDAKVISVAALPRSDKDDQLWIVAERTVDGVTRRTVEVMADDVFFPDPEDFFSDADSADDDAELYANAVYRRQEDYIHMDGAGTFDGSARGVTAAATLTPAAVTGTGITFTASAAVFVAADVGRQIWKKPSGTTGIGSGRGTITAVGGGGTTATVTILVDFDATTAIPAGDWHITAVTISGLHSLEGQTVAVLTDGAVYSDGRGNAPVVTVSNGQITLADDAAVVHVGLPYDGILETQNLEMGGRSGPAQSKPRNIVKMFIRFLNTLGVNYGTDLYRLDQVRHRENTFNTSRPSPVFSGIRDLHYSDRWSRPEEEKRVIVSQMLPLPCTVQFVDVQYETGDEG